MGLIKKITSGLTAIAMSLPYAAKAEEKHFFAPSHASAAGGYAVSGPSLNLHLDSSALNLKSPHNLFGKKTYDRIMISVDATAKIGKEHFEIARADAAYLKEVYILAENGNPSDANYERSALETGVMAGGGSELSLHGANDSNLSFYGGLRHGLSFVKDKGINFKTKYGKSASFSAYMDFPVIGALLLENEKALLFGGGFRTRLEWTVYKGLGMGASLNGIILKASDNAVLEQTADLFMKAVLSERNRFLNRVVFGVRGRTLHSNEFRDYAGYLFVGIEG